MKKSMLTLLIFFTTALCYAQKLPWFLSHDSKYQYSPLYVIHTPDKTIKTFDDDIFSNLLAPYIDSLKILNGPAAVKIYGQKAKYGAIVFRYKDEVVEDTNKRINLYDLITEMDMGIKTILPIYLDHQYIKYPKDVYLDKEKVIGVEQRIEKAYHNATYFSVLTQKFMNDSIKMDSLKKLNAAKKVTDAANTPAK